MAAGSREIKSGGAAIYLRLDKTAFAAGLKSAAGELKAFGGSIRNIGAGMAGAGAALGGALFAATKMFANTGDELRDLALRTGMSVEALSQLKFAAGQAGAGLEDVEVGAKGMNKFLSTAAEGSKTATDTLADLGLTLGQLKSLSPDQMFTKFADAIAAVPDPSKRAALAMEVFGKSGTKLLPLFIEGTAKAKALADAMGLTFTKEDADRADAFNDALGGLMATAKAAVVQIGSALAGGLQGVIEKLTAGTVEVVKFIKAHNDLIVVAAKAAGALTAVGTAILGIGIAIQTVGFAMGGFANLLGTISKAGKALSIFGSIAAAVATPVGLLVTAVTFLAGAIALVRSRSESLRDEQSKQNDLVKDLTKNENLHADAIMSVADAQAAMAKSIATENDRVAKLNEELSKTGDLIKELAGPMNMNELADDLKAINREWMLIGTPALMDVMPAVSPGFDEFMKRGYRERTEDGVDALDDAIKSESIIGTFNASRGGIQSLQGGGFKSMVDEQKETNRQLEEANRRLNQVAVFKK